MGEQSPIPLQSNFLSGELEDTRNREQRRADKERLQPQQPLLFSQREIAQFGVRPNPVMPFSPGKLRLIQEDPRNEEEIEQDRLKEAQRQTIPLFEPQRQVQFVTSRSMPPIPILWMTREDLLQRRPDLASQIQGLSEHELTALGALVSEALEAFYQMQLNIVLTLCFDRRFESHQQSVTD